MWKTGNASYLTSRPCNGSTDYRDGSLGCWGQYFRAVTGQNIWTIWQWQPATAAYATSGWRHLPADNSYVAVYAYTSATSTWAGRCTQITLLDAKNLMTAFSAITVGVLVTFF